jgi:hypothetical protein
VEAAGGVFLRRTSGVTADHQRWLRPEPPFHRTHMGADVVRQANVVTPKEQDIIFWPARRWR